MHVEEVEIAETLVPSTVPEACEMVARLAAEKHAVFPIGGGTALDYGNPAARSGVGIDCTHLARVVDYPSEDMTITVEAGIQMAELQQILRQKGQTLPVDCPAPDRATLGGVMATNTSGPRRFGYGTMRDYVLGIDVIDADGKRIHGGGRVVKNVAGYDMMKMHIGALGALGIIVQASLKLKPLPEARVAVGWTIDGERLETVLDALNCTQTRPVGVEVLSAHAATRCRITLTAPLSWGLIVLFEESQAAVWWQLEQISREMASIGVTECLRAEHDAYGMCLADLTCFPSLCEPAIIAKVSVLPGHVADFCRKAIQLITDCEILAHAGNGIIYLSCPSGERSIANAVLDLRAIAHERHGSLVLQRAPIALKRISGVFGNRRAGTELMRILKRKLDPGDVFNPGRALDLCV